MIDHRVAARVDDAGLAQDGQQLGAAADRLLAGRERALEDVGDERVLARGVGLGGRGGSSGMCASSVATEVAISRMTVSIVPSAGARTEA